MSWSTSSIAWPASATSLRRRPSSSLSCESSPAAGSSRQSEPRLRRERPGDPDQLPLPLRQVGGHLVHLRLQAEQRQRASTARSRRPAARATSFTVAQVDGRYEATARFSPTVRSSKSSIDCHVRASPRRARTCARSPSSALPVELDAAAVGDEARDRVDEGRLPRAVRADQPDELPLADLEVDVVECAQRRRTRRRSPWRRERRSRGSFPPRGRGRGTNRRAERAPRGRQPLLLLLLLLVARPGDALRVDEQRDDQREPADEQRPVPVQPNHSSKACGKRPSVAPIPAITAPETIVIPPK